jgi:hypothetical protein
MRPTILLVHALNPFGFSTSRRVNEENIDLNRNFLTEAEFKEVVNRDPNFAGYVTIDYLINPTKLLFPTIFLNEWFEFFKSIYAILRYGILFIKRAIVAGNYYMPTGLGYGGTKLSTSAKSLIDLVTKLEIPKRAKNVVLIDVHTGLGPSGVDTLLGDLSSDSRALLEKIFPTEYEKPENRSFFQRFLYSSSPKIIGGIKDTITGKFTYNPTS